MVVAGQTLGGLPGSGAQPDEPSSTAHAVAGTTPSPIPGLPGTPVLASPDVALVADETVEIAGTLPPDLVRDNELRLRIYVNGTLVRERRLPPDHDFIVRNVPLEQGQNEVRAALAGPDGEGLHSAPIVIQRDDQPPPLQLHRARDGEIVYAEEMLIRGRTEPAAWVSITNETTAQRAEVAGDEEGDFEVRLRLAVGPNEIVLEARDELGNRSRTSVTLVRAEGSDAVELTLSRDSLSLDALPSSITLTAFVTDESGAAVDGAEVTFSVSPPGQPTMTHRATSRAGVATWRGVRVPREGAVPGQGFATVLAVLPSGRTLQGSATFRLR